MTIEPPQLGLKIYKNYSPKQWLFRDISPSALVLSMAMLGGEIVAPPSGKVHSWSLLEEEQISVDFPSSHYDCIYLHKVLENYSVDKRKIFIKECGRMLKPGGALLSISAACDDGIEIHELLVSLGENVERLTASRLTNKEILSARPHEAAFFEGAINFRQRKRLAKYLQGKGYGVCLESMWRVPQPFSVKNFMVGMKWYKKEEK